MKSLTRQRYWAQHLETWHSSGLSQNTYCQQHNLKANQFSYWKRKLAAPNGKKKSQLPSTTAFIPLTVDGTHSSTKGLSLRLPNGCEFSGIDMRDLPLIKQLIGALL